MTTTEQRCRDAAMDVMLERAFLGDGPDVADRVLARRRGPAPTAIAPTRRARGAGLLRAAVAAFALGAVFAVGLWGGGRRDEAAQEPASEREVVTVRDAAHLRALAASVRAATAGHVQVVLMDFAAGAGRAQQVDYVDVPDVRVAFEQSAALLELVARAVDRPVEESGLFPDALLDLRFTVGERRDVVVRCHRVLERFAISVRGPGFRYVDGALAARLDALFAEVAAARAGSFVFATTAAELAAAPPTVRHVLTYGLGDEDLAGLARFADVERVELVARRLDEYPQRYEGVPLTAGGLRALAGCRRLRDVVLRGAQLDDDGLAVLSRLPALSRLVVAEGRDRATFTAEGLAALAAAPALADVELSECGALDDAGLRAMASAPALRRARIDRAAAVTGDGLGALLAAPRLERVELVGVTCEGLFDGAAEAARERPLRLRQLELAGCRCELAGIVSLPFLRELSLDGCELVDGSVAAIATSRVEELTLRRCDFAFEELLGLGDAAMLTDLGIVQMRGRRDWRPVLAALGRLPRLSDLRLIQCGLGDDDLAELPGFAALKSLDLRHHAFGEARREALRRRFEGVVLRL